MHEYVHVHEYEQILVVRGRERGKSVLRAWAWNWGDAACVAAYVQNDEGCRVPVLGPA